MWNRAPQWPGSAARGDFLGNARAVPSDPALGRPDTSDPYSTGQFLPALAPVPTVPDEDQIRTDAYVAPYTGPLDLDDYGRETDEMRRAYDDLHRKEPAVRSAIDGKAASVAALDLIVKPRDKTKPNDVAAAAFVKEQLEQSEHGPDGLILNMLRAAFIRGWAVLEKTFRAVPGPTGPRWGLLHCKSRDTAHLRLRLDGYRNVLGVVNTVRGVRTHDPRKVILFTHADLYSNPYGQSDLRAAYRSANLINDAYQLWHIAVKVFGGPFLKGKVSDQARRKQMEAALRAARAAGTIVTPDDDDVEILNMASATSFDAFEKKVRIHREEIYLAVRHAYMPFMQSSSGGADQRGDTGVNKSAGSDPLEFLIAKAVGRVLSHQLAPDLVAPNFPAGTGVPIVQLGGTSWGETKAQLDVAATLWDKWQIPVSAEYLYDVTQMPPPKGPGDVPPAATGGGGGGGPGAPAPPAPSALGNPAAPDSTAPAGPAPVPVGAGTAPNAAPAQPVAPASAFSAEQAPKYASYFAASRHGHYPGDLHEQFGLGVAQFAAATGLLRRQVRRAGAPGWVWAPPAVPPQPPPAPPPAPVEFALGAAVPVPVALLGTDPARLQWRPGANPADGTARQLPAEQYDPAKAGTLLGWRDPANGRALVVEGHHRLAHARRDGVASVPVRFVDAPDAETARAIGRRANERGSAFASEHAEGEEWESNGRRYKRTGGETVRVGSGAEQGGGTASAAPAHPQPASAPAGAPPSAPEVPAEVRAAGESIAQEIAANSGEPIPAGVFGKLKQLALAAAVNVYATAARVKESAVGGLVASALDAFFDGPKDLEKLGYNPTNSSGGAGPQVLDPVKNTTEDALGVGISGHLAAKVAAVALTKALFWLKGKLGGSQMAALDPTGELAAALADLFEAANASVGLGPVDRTGVAAAVSQLGAGVASFAQERQEGEEWTTNGRKYKREGGKTLRVGTAGGADGADSQGTAAPPPAAPPPPEPTTPAAPQTAQHARGASAPATDPPTIPQGVTFSDTASALVERAFGREVEPGLFAALVNAPSDQNASVTVADDSGPGGVQLTVSTTFDGGSAIRLVVRAEPGAAPHVENWDFRILTNPGPDGRPVPQNPALDGFELMVNQIRAARALSVGRITAIAARNDNDDINKKQVGYRIWPERGFDGSIPEKAWAKLPAELRQQVEANAVGSSVPKSIIALVSTPAGNSWWRANGVSIDEVAFDTADGSLSMRILAEFMQRRAGGA